MRSVVFRDDHDARRSPIESMHDARPTLAANPAQVRDVMQERVHERARGVPCARMHHHARRLVHDDDIRILVENLERHRLGFHRRGRSGGKTHDNPVASMNGKVGPRVASGDAHMAVGNQLLDLGARVVGEDGDEKAIEALSFGIRINGKLQRR